jgi:hypothetical protein
MDAHTYYDGIPQVRPAKYVVAGHRDEFVIVFSAPRYPERFASEAAAAAVSRKCGRPYEKQSVPVYRRITP